MSIGNSFSIKHNGIEQQKVMQSAQLDVVLGFCNNVIKRYMS